MTGLFSQLCGWIANSVKLVGKVCNVGHRASAFLWWDGHNLRIVGSPELIKKIETSKSCGECCQTGTYEEAAKKDVVDLSTGSVTVDIDYNQSNQEVIQSITENEGMTLLPCPVAIMNLVQLLAWCRIELNKDYIEQGLNPVSKIPWGKAYCCVLLRYNIMRYLSRKGLIPSVVLGQRPVALADSHQSSPCMSNWSDWWHGEDRGAETGCQESLCIER